LQIEQYHTVSNKRDRCWAEISLTNLANNIAHIRAAIAPQVKIMGVIKGDAYGHGAVMTARTMIDCGVEYLAVATVDEALELRCNDIKTPILVLGYTDVSRAMDIVANDLTQTVYELTLPEAMSLAAIKLNKTAKIHLKIETD
jgi:alanine racemase